MIERNLVHVRALLASIEAVNETSALDARLEARTRLGVRRKQHRLPA